MIITIEVLILFVLVAVVIAFLGVTQLTKLIKLWRYKKENDKGKLAEESRRRGTTESGNIQRTVQPKRRRLFPFARPVNKPESSGIVREDSHRIRNPFKPRRK